MTTDNYVPKVGHAVVARRRRPVIKYPNLVVGPITAVYHDRCIMHNNPGMEIERRYTFYFSEWYFEFLHEVRHG